MNRLRKSFNRLSGTDLRSYLTGMAAFLFAMAAAGCWQESGPESVSGQGGESGLSTALAIAPGPYQLQAVHSGKCVDVAAVSMEDAANIHQWSCNGKTNQQFSLRDLGGNLYELKAVHSGKCADVGGWSNSDGGNIIQWPCHGNNNQKWQLIERGNGEVQFRSAHSGKCLDVSGISTGDGANIHQWACHSMGNQRFRLTAVTPEPPKPVDPTPSPWANSLVTDFGTTGIIGNPNWYISTWGSANRTHSADNLWREGDSVLVMKVTGGTPLGQTTTGAEIVTTSNRYLYGSYRILWKTSVEPGTVNGFFYYLNDQSEIDIEIMGSENAQGLVHFTVHKVINGNSHVQLPMGFDPSKAFHEYRFDWLKDRVEFYVDGKLLATLSPPAINVPYQPGYIMLNHWSLSDPGWGGGPPVRDALMYVKWIDLRY